MDFSLLPVPVFFSFFFFFLPSQSPSTIPFEQSSMTKSCERCRLLFVFMKKEWKERKTCISTSGLINFNFWLDFSNKCNDNLGWGGGLSRRVATLQLMRQTELNEYSSFISSRSRRILIVCFIAKDNFVYTLKSGDMDLLWASVSSNENWREWQSLNKN